MAAGWRCQWGKFGQYRAHDGGWNQRVMEYSPPPAPSCIGEGWPDSSHALGSMVAHRQGGV